MIFTVFPYKVLVVEITLALDPVGLIDRMHAVWPFEGTIRKAVGFMTYRAFPERPCMTLQLNCGDIVIGIWIPVGPNGMGTAVTGFTGETPMLIKTVR